MVCGDQHPVFTRKEIMKYTEPQHGYNKKSLGFLRFMNVLVGIIGEERKALLQFTTALLDVPPFPKWLGQPSYKLSVGYPGPGLDARRRTPALCSSYSII